MKSISLIILFLFSISFFASANVTTVDEAFQLLNKELGLSPTQKPAVKEILNQFAEKFAGMSSLSGSLKSKAVDTGFGDLKSALSKILNAEQMAKLDGLKAKLVGLLGVKI
ncbi:MAG: hypothetical protein H7329_19500 [Opitutaceae bacterium]|nr:hypothetical protein [Cytophagales bacterium]